MMMNRIWVIILILVPIIMAGCIGGEEKDNIKKKEGIVDEAGALTQNIINVTLDEGNTGTISIPIVGAAIVETDVKKHWDMPSNITKVTANLTWDKSGWDLEFSIGTGECPDNGETKASKEGNNGIISIEYSAINGTLEEGQWFAHVRVKDPTSHRGDSLDFTITVVLYQIKNLS